MMLLLCIVQGQEIAQTSRTAADIAVRLHLGPYLSWLFVCIPVMIRVLCSSAL
ncbi:hypothetical protein M378DRAFT_155918 [Amanita muscaria Koide BX008]|uniref:Uncharacterized protein n=1 Tax=Amanita muscaria (strain Koide BX008) TaxID=946122 RepID=A0A0C2TUK9_AMAMK|nr:hypothetical protein M378DRAFT_155918 [Amanita muscaria Koide BX008]